MNRLVRLVLFMLLVTMVLGACEAPAPHNTPTPQPQPTPTPLPPSTPTPEPPLQIANPASQNCIAQGGKLEIRTRADGSQYGVCYFEDNRQCEEWALFYGDCPVGGRKITGYVTEAAQFCAITGGTYQVTGNSNTDQETGTCTFKTGKVCDAAQYFAGTCDRTVAPGQETYSDPFAYCQAVGTVDKPDARYTGAAVPAGVVLGLIRERVVSADAPADFQNHATWRCMDGRVYACHYGANLPCDEKADSSQTPSAEMTDFCKANLNAEVIPAAVTGRATVYDWRCTDGKPAVVKQVFTPDAQGFLKEFWYQLDENGPVTYSDPFAYCAAVGTIDAPDARYSGEPVPAAVVDAMVRQKIVTADAPAEFQKNAVWRCVSGQVYACHFGANLPCQEKADTSQMPTTEMTDFCKANLNAEVIPAVVTGRSTVFEWKCDNGKPAVVKQVFAADEQGFIQDFWYLLTP